MPKMPKRYCDEPRCRREAVSGGKCDDHARPKHRWDHQGRTRQERGYGRDWQLLRMEALERDAWLCQEHLKLGVYVSATDVDHITPKSKGGADRLDNLQSLCKTCHMLKTAREGSGHDY